MPLRFLRLFLSFAVLACLSLHAKDITSAWFADGKFLEESASQRMTNDFGGRLDFTDDPFFILKWQTNWTSISSIKRLERVYIVLFVASKNDVGQQDVVYDITIKMPDGSVSSCFTNQPVVYQPLRAQPLHPTTDIQDDLKPVLRLNYRATVFYTDPPDPVGIYTVEVELRDRVRKTSVKLTKQLNITK